MVTFIGEYTARIDDKGRLVFPSPLKAALPPGSDMRFVVKKDLFEPCLQMYTMEEWTRQSEKVKDSLDLTFNKTHAKFWREYMRNRAIVEPDSKLGRITVPKKLLEAIGVDKEVVFSGNDHKIEIWAKDRYESGAVSEEEIISLAGMFSDMK